MKNRGIIITEGEGIRMIEKTGGDGESYYVPNPDWQDEDGNFKKFRKKNTHLTPKKKKRK
jgi:hypothetical protein